MSRSAEELWDLLDESLRMPYGAARTAVNEEVIRHADATGDRSLAFAARMYGTNAYVYGGEPARSFVTFSWCLSDFDRAPAPYHGNWHDQLLWNFKQMVSALTKFPEVPLARTYAVLDDMERRYREAGHGMQAVHKYRYVVAKHIGDRAETDRLYELWNTVPRDDLSDCVGCDPSDQVRHLAGHGRDDEAITLAEPVLAGHLTCTEQPQTILSALMVPYLRAGRLDEAVNAHRRAYRIQRSRLAELGDIGDHVEFCARTGNEHRGLEILRRHVDWLDKAPSPAAGMHFAAAGAMLLRRLTALGHGAATVRRRDRGEIPLADLGDELAAYATDLSRRFDARNGTSAVGEEIAGKIAAEPYDVVLPLSPTARPAVAPAGPRPEPEPVKPALTDAAALLDLAEEHEDADRIADLRVTVAAFDERFPEIDALDPEPAARRLMLLGGELWQADDDKGAIRAWERVVEKTADPIRSSTARARIGVARCLLGDAEAGLPPVEADVAVQDRHGDTRGRARALGRLAAALLVVGRFEEALAVQDRADAVAAEAGDERMIAQFAVRRAQQLAALHRHAEAERSVAAAVRFYQEHGPASMLAPARMLHGRIAEDPEVALAAFTEVLSTGEPRMALDARLGRGQALMNLRRASEAVPDLVEAVALCAEQDLAEAGAWVRKELAHAYRAADRLPEAAEVAEEAVLWLDRTDQHATADEARLLMAVIYRELGENEDALARYDELVGRLGDNPAGLSQIHEYAGDLLYRMDRDAEAAERFRLAAESGLAAEDPLAELRTRRRRVDALRWSGDEEAALAAAAEARQRHADLAEQVGDEPAAVFERAMLGYETARLRFDRGEYDAALAELGDGPERLRSVGADGPADQAERLRGEVLLGLGRPAEAEAVLRALLDRRDGEDEDGHLAALLAEARSRRRAE